MLIKAKKQDVEKHIDFVYNIALDQTKSGYPIYTDGIKTRKDFVDSTQKAFTYEEEEILIFENEGIVEGWIQYYWIPEDKYIQMKACNINNFSEIALKEFIELVEVNFRGYELYLGFPKCNTVAVEFFKEKGLQCIEDDYNDSFFFDEYECIPASENIIKISIENYHEFRKIHSQNDNDKEIYWNSDRIFEDIDNWNIFVYYKDKNPKGAIYFRDLGVMLEIFGINYIDGVYCEETYKMLVIKALNEGKIMGCKYLTFFNDQESQRAALELGFKCVGQYVCYFKQL